MRPDLSNNLLESLLKAGKDHARGITFITGPAQEEFLSYNALFEVASGVLTFLRKKGLRKGTELVFQISNERDFVIVFWACILGGIIPVPLTVVSTRAHANKFFRVCETLTNLHIIGDAGALKEVLDQAEMVDTMLMSRIRKHIISIDDIYSESKASESSEVDQDDIAFIQFSSGSTANPKGVVLTHRNLIANMEGISVAAAYAPGDRMLSWMPLTHDMGMIGFHLNPIYSGIDQFIISTKLFIKEPSVWLEKATQHKITITSSPNFGYKYLLLRTDLSVQHFDLSRVRIIYNGAEPISLKVCNEFLDKMEQFGLRRASMVPVYGLAEASVAVSMSELSANVQSVRVDRSSLNFKGKVRIIDPGHEGASFINVGKVIPFCELRIGDAEGNALDEAVVGQIQIKGVNVCRGYYNNRKAYDAVMTREGWLDTGDLGFFLDGDLFITGRSKDVIFINGQNYYAHDIEGDMETVAEMRAIGFVVAGYFDTRSETEKVLAFVHYKGQLDAFIPLMDDMQSAVKRAFGFEYSAVIPVKSIPKTTSGKVQRFELLNAYHRGEYDQTLNAIRAATMSTAHDQQEGETSDQEKLLSIWKEVLKIKSLSPDDSFVTVGGNSIDAVAVCNLVGKQWGVELTLEKLYALKTIRNIADNLAELPARNRVVLSRSSRRDRYPLSKIQLALYYRWKTYPDSIAYNVPVILSAKGKPDLEKIGNILTTLVQRHEALRMYFTDGETPSCRFDFNHDAELTAMKYEGDLEATVRSLVTPFNLHKGPLFRSFVLENSHGENFHLFLDFHHIIADGQSVQLFLREFCRLYHGHPLQAKQFDYADFIEWQESQTAQLLATHRTFWSETLAEVPILELPLDKSRPVTNDFEGNRLSFSMQKDLLDEVVAYCKKESLTAHNFLFACYYILLSRYSLQKEIVIGIPLHGRNDQGLNNVFGMFVNSLPVKIADPGDLTARAFLQLASGKIIQAMSHGELPYFDILSVVDHPYYHGRNPLFDTMFIYRQGLSAQEFNAYHFTAALPELNVSKFDISLEFTADDGRAAYTIEYATELFEEESIRRFASGYHKIISDICANPDMLLSDLSVISSDDTAKIKGLLEGETTKTGSKFSAVHHLFFKQVDRQPHAIALEHEAVAVTYGELSGRIRQFTHLLLSHKVQHGEVVAILLPRSIEMIVSIFGIMNAGCAFLPVDHEMPLQRKAELIRSSKCRYIISSELLVRKIDLKDLNCSLIATEGLDQQITSKTRRSAQPDDLCYLMYTSGSTGKPKGVMVTHGNLHNYITFARDEYFGSEALAVPLYSSVSFDLTITSIFAPLISGGRIVIYEKKNADEVLIERVFRENRVDLVKMTPAHLKLLLNNKLVTSSTRVQTYILGGEALPAEWIHQLIALTSPKIAVFNEYGPTEATVGCITHKFNNDQHAQVPIGNSIDNMTSYILDESFRPVPYNVVGELYLTGKGLAQGYFNQPELTRERFITNPFVEGGRMYKTGDLARLSPRGYIQYVGRNDRQVKLNGYRVELGEVESKIATHPGVSEAVVLHLKTPHSKLVAYFLTKLNDSILSGPDVRSFLETRLPPYMIPEELIRVPVIPFTSNGKVDVQKLLQLRATVDIVQVEGIQSDVESVLLKVWREFFGNAAITSHTNAYELGLDSIKAVQLSARLLESGIRVRAKDILSLGSIRALGPYCEIAADEHESPALLQGSFRPTPIMSWFLSASHKNPNFYNQSVLLELKTPASDFALLTVAFGSLIRKHSTLRINFDTTANSLHYNNDHLLSMHVVESYAVADLNELKERCETLKKEFDLSSSLLIKAAIITYESHTFLFITAHHLVVDGVSWRILLQDLYAFMKSLKNKEAISTRNTSATFKDWSDRLQTSAHPQQFYNVNLESIPGITFRLPHDMEDDQWLVRSQDSCDFALDKLDTAQLVEESRKVYHADLNVLLNAAVISVLYEITGQDKIHIEQESHGRYDDTLNLGGTVGWFTALYPVVFSYHGEMVRLIKSTKETLQQVSEHGLQAYSEASQGWKRPGIRLNYLGEFGAALDNELFRLNSQIDIGKEQDDRNFISAELEINAMIVSQKLQLKILYNARAHHRRTIVDTGNRIVRFLQEALMHMKEETNPHFTPSDFKADLSQEELDMLLR